MEPVQAIRDMYVSLPPQATLQVFSVTAQLLHPLLPEQFWATRRLLTVKVISRVRGAHRYLLLQARFLIYEFAHVKNICAVTFEWCFGLFDRYPARFLIYLFPKQASRLC